MALFYITFGTYNGFEKYELQYSPAANQKTNFIINLLERTKRKFTVISLSRTGKKKLTWIPAQEAMCGKNGKYIVWGMLGKPIKAIGVIQKELRIFQLKSFLKTLSTNDTVIAYHSLFISKTLIEAKEQYNFNLILELEEIYQDVVHCGKTKAYWEKKVISVADGYILATEALAREIPAGRPYMVINGTYHVEKQLQVSFNDGKIHCVYAGTFDPTKGGAAAAAAAEFLPENYHVHILGFGTEKQKRELLDLVANVQKKAKCTLTYDGLKSGEEYIQFLQKCQIGLCTQIPDAKYAETSFPSKILVYLANGLRVLSVRIPVVEQSKVGGNLYYYNIQSPQEIAKAILSIPVDENYDSRHILDDLNVKCGEEFKKLIERISNEHIGEA